MFHPDISFGLDFHLMSRVDQGDHLHHAGGRPDLTEHFPVRPPDGPLLRDVGHVNAGADHMAQFGPGRRERPGDDTQCYAGLGGGVSGVGHHALHGGGGAFHVNMRPHPYRRRVADQSLPERSSGNATARDSA